MGQLATAYAAVEAEIVPNHGARACLAADGPRLDDQRVQAFGGPIDGRGDTGRPGTEHDQVIDGSGGSDLDAVGEDHFCHRRLLQHDPVVSDERRQPSHVHPVVADQLAAAVAVLVWNANGTPSSAEGVSQVRPAARSMLAVARPAPEA